MKAFIPLFLLSVLGSAVALPADIEPRFIFSFPTFPGKKTTTISIKTTTLPATTALSSTAPTTTTTTTTSAVTTTVSSVTPIATTTTTTTTSKTTSTPPTSTGASTSTGGDTENGVVNGGCTELTVIFARGTGESGNVGTVSGPPMFKALRSALGTSKVTVQGVDYPASSSGNSNLGADGGPAMASLVYQALSQCPSTKIALSGYSQGAMVVHNAVAQQGLSASQISAVVLFGDPMNGQSVGSVPANKLLEICASGDDVCNGSGTFAITQAHLSYGQNATQAANFIITTAGVS